MAYFPFMIEMEGKACLVAGGGRIAFHKVKILTDFGARVRVVAPTICGPLCELAGCENGRLINLIEREFRESDIDGMDFVVAATDEEELNYHISELCKKRGILINAVDMKEACSFAFPAIIKDKDLVIAVSSGGKSPAAAAYIKRKIRQGLPDYYGTMIEQLGAYRDYIFERAADLEKRKGVFNRLLEYGAANEGEIPKEIVEIALKTEDGWSEPEHEKGNSDRDEKKQAGPDPDGNGHPGTAKEISGLGSGDGTHKHEGRPDAG